QRRTVLTTGSRDWQATTLRQHRQAIQVAPDGDFRPPPGITVGHEHSQGRWRGNDRLREFVRLLAERGTPPWRPEAAVRLAAATGMTSGEAAYLFGGMPEVQAYQASLPTAQQRTALGLSSPQAKAAKATFAALQP